MFTTITINFCLCEHGIYVVYWTVS